MKEKWHDIAKINLDPEDQIQKSHSGHYRDKDGIIVITNRKLLFVEEKKDFLRKTYRVALAIPYERVNKITVMDNRSISLTELEGRNHIFRFYDVSALTIKTHLDELYKSIQIQRDRKEVVNTILRVL